MLNLKKFPGDFIFGCSTAAYQIEGAYKEDGRGVSIWDTFSHINGKIKNNDTGDIACDHYHLYKDDIALMKEIGVKAYRFSIAWPRILPDGTGQINQKGLDFYDNLIDELLNNNIIPYITLFHWDLPQALFDKFEGFAGREIIKYFQEYTEVVVKKYCDRVKSWVTLNEPWVHAFNGYARGIFAPGVMNLKKAVDCVHNQLIASGAAIKTIREFSPESEAGITLNLSPVYSSTDSTEDKYSAMIADQYFNTIFLDPLFKGEYPKEFFKHMDVYPDVQPGDMDLITTPMDFLGINLYSRIIVKHEKTNNGFIHHDLAVNENKNDKCNKQYTSMGWEVYPYALYETLIRIKNEYGNIKVYITENGAAYEDVVVNGKVIDKERKNYLISHINKVHEAIKDGCNVKAYFVWSLLDNFEWAEGYSKRFGIIYVDYESQKRIIKDSGKWYMKFLK